nr:hypothetical protein CFOL_v3_17882 [Ipomoea batatas]
MVSANKGNCRNANNVTGRQATNSTGNTTHANCLLSTIEKLEPNATSIAVMERKSVASPKTNLFGNEMASDTAKATNSLSWRKIGFPVSLLFPPGTVRIAANMIVVIRNPSPCLPENAEGFLAKIWSTVSPFGSRSIASAGFCIRICRVTSVQNGTNLHNVKSCFPAFGDLGSYCIWVKTDEFISFLPITLERSLRDVRMDKNISVEVTEENRAMASDTAKITNNLSWRKIGFPVPLLSPPGTVRIAANMIVVIRILVCSYAVDEPEDLFLAVNDSNVENTLALLIHLPYQIRISANKMENKLNVS